MFESRRIGSLSDEREREELPFCLPAIVSSNCVQTKIYLFFLFFSVMWRVTEAPWRMLHKVFVLFLCGVQMVLRSGVLAILISSRLISRRVLLRSLGRCCLGLVALLVADGAAGVLSVSLNCPLPLRRTHPPTLVCCLCFCSDGSDRHNIWAAGGKSVVIWELN